MSLSPATAAFPTLRPWRSLIGPSSRPCSLSETTLRLRRNLKHFRSNYLLLSLLILFLSLLFHPIALIVFLAVLLLWIFLYFSRSHPFVVSNHYVDDRLVLVVMFIVTVVALVLTGVWLNVLVSGVVAVLVVGVHGVFRVPDDLFLDEDEAASGGLLSVVGGSPPPARTRSTFASV